VIILIGVCIHSASNSEIVRQARSRYGYGRTTGLKRCCWFLNSSSGQRSQPFTLENAVLFSLPTEMFLAFWVMLVRMSLEVTVYNFTFCSLIFMTQPTVSDVPVVTLYNILFNGSSQIYINMLPGFLKIIFL
jgi:hypothetical protein